MIFCEKSNFQTTGHLCALHLGVLSIWRSIEKLVCIEKFPAQNNLFGIGHGGPWCSFLLKETENRAGCDKAASIVQGLQGSPYV